MCLATMTYVYVYSDRFQIYIVSRSYSIATCSYALLRVCPSNYSSLVTRPHLLRGEGDLHLLDKVMLYAGHVLADTRCN